VESDGHARSTCGVRELRQPPVRRSVRQRAAAARRPTSIVCWWQSGDAGAPRIGAARRRRRALRRSAERPAAPAGRRFAHFVLDLFRDGPPRSSVRPTLRPTRHSPPHGDIRVVPGWWPLNCAWFRSRPDARAEVRGHRQTGGIERSSISPRVNPFSPNPRARGARRWRRGAS